MLKISKGTELVKREKWHGYTLFHSGKSCFVIARSTFYYRLEFIVPGFLLMQQSIENLIKAILFQLKIDWPTGRKGHDIEFLLKTGSNRVCTFEKILKNKKHVVLLKELSNGYNTSRYGEAGHQIQFDPMMNTFDEIIYSLIQEFGNIIGRKGDALDRLLSLPIPKELEKQFAKGLKQPFIFGVDEI